MVKSTKNLAKRKIFPAVLDHLKKPEITMLVGPRQVGKTTLLYQLKEELARQGVAADRVLFFNLDVFADLELFSSQQKFIDFLKERASKKKLFVFVDEAQRVKNPGIFFKGVYDLNLPVKLVLTGSSALEIKSKIQEPLTGRKRVFYLYPFLFQEYLSAVDPGLAGLVQKKKISEHSLKQVLKHFYSFAVWGGYPRVALEGNINEKRELLKEIYSSYLEKDIVSFLNIKNHSAFVNLISLLAGQTGQLVNVQELSQSLRVERKTIEKYLEILEKTFIVKQVSPFFRNARKELVKMPKIYFTDNGWRNFSLNLFQDFEKRADKGSLLENFVFSEILKQGAEIRFWRTKEKAEVDFILKDSQGKLLPLEVKASFLSSPEISRSFRSFLNQYSPEKGIVVNLGFQGKASVKKTQVNYILPFEGEFDII